jgi:transposase
LKPTTLSLNQTIAHVEQLLNDDPHTSPAIKSAVALLIVVVKLMAGHLGLDSHNSSKPPSTDPNRERKVRTLSDKKAGGQPNHKGSTLTLCEEPDEIKTIAIDRRTLPKGHYSEDGYEVRQIIDLHIERVVTEYRAQVLKNETGKRFVAEFPPEVTRPVQYGASVKANAVYMSMFQLIPYERVQTHFAEQFSISLSAGSLLNFNQDAYTRLEMFETLAKHCLAQEKVLHVDETGINVNGKRMWLHNASSEHWTLFYPHENRGKVAMDEMGVLPNFKGTLIHDHWKPYYRYTCTHALCNSHHLRELTHAHEEDNQLWAKDMHELLREINHEVSIERGVLNAEKSDAYRHRYRELLHKADSECPAPDTVKEPPKRGKIKRSKSRNLLERLRDYEADVLRFMVDVYVPFTNNQGERDIRMTKVQQKISGCFRSMEGAKVFCRIRAYLSTCRKQGVGVGEALDCLFNGTWPDFILKKMAGAE